MVSTYNAIIIGAGPGGLSTAAALLDTGLNNILWVDRDFTGGRLNTLYREISSNTKTGIYLDAVRLSKTCSDVIDSTPKPNAVTRLEEIDREETCQLSSAGDMIMMLMGGILDLEEVEKCLDEVVKAELRDGQWTITLRSGRTASTPQLHLSTGSHPRKLSIHEKYKPRLQFLDLDQTMILSSLPSLLPSDKPSVVGIIGNSHSGILATMNLYLVSTSDDEEKKRDVRIINFQRREIIFAEYRDDGIVWDNSGLKGRTADWAKENMINHPADNITQIRFDQSSESEEEIYKKYLPECTHLIYAIGYDPNPIPQLTINSRKVKQEDLQFDMHSSGFTLKSGERVQGLYGTGIAFPEETEDPEGHVEAAVGFAKFIKFAERVKGEWGRVV